MKKNYVKKCLMVSLALSMTVATVTFADTLTGDGYANEQETEVYTAGTPDLTTQNETTSEESENPVKHYGWYTDEETGNTYYFDSEGKIQTGWKQSGNTWYYLDGENTEYQGRRIEKEWKKIKNVWYYFKADGVMATGWQKIGNKWYYLKESGAMTTGWQKVGNMWYYMNGSGAMLTGWQKISSNRLAEDQW